MVFLLFVNKLTKIKLLNIIFKTLQIIKVQPNLLFILVDSLRADKFFGKEKTSLTPNIDSFISKGVYLKNNFSSSDGTVLSWASIFTSLHPFKTGVTGRRLNKISSNVKTHFEVLQNLGYSAYSCVPKVAYAVGLLDNFTNEDRTYPIFTNLDDGLGEKIISKLQPNKMKEPWVFFVHINDIHFPIKPPKLYDHDKYGSSKYERMISSIDFWLGKIIKEVDLSKTTVVISADHGSYIHNVKHDDQEIDFEPDGKLQQTVTKLANKIPASLEPAKRKSFFLLESVRKKTKERKIKNLDLSEKEKRSLLAQRGDSDHFLFDEKIHVPLLFMGCGIKKPKIISDQTRSIDIFPTLFDIMNLENSLKTVDGKSVFPLFEEKTLDELPAIIQSSPQIEIKSNDVIGVRTKDFKYFRDVDDAGKRVHLFNLINDVDEEENIASLMPEKILELENMLQKESLSNKTETMDLDEDEMKNIEKELKKLGYV